MSIVTDDNVFDMKKMEDEIPGVSQKARARKIKEILLHEVHTLTRDQKIGLNAAAEARANVLVTPAVYEKIQILAQHDGEIGKIMEKHKKIMEEHEKSKSLSKSKEVENEDDEEEDLNKAYNVNLKKKECLQEHEGKMKNKKSIEKEQNFGAEVRWM